MRKNKLKKKQERKIGRKLNWEEGKNSPGRKIQVDFMSNTWALQSIAISLIHGP